jgi:peptidoglycan/LPS O-acetylase OafA/YrhL
VIKLTFDVLPQLWPLACGIIVLAIIAFVIRRGRQGIFGLAAAILWVVIGPVWIILGLVPLQPRTEAYDVNAWLLAAALPLIVAAIAGRNASRLDQAPRTRAVYVFGSGLLALLACPWILLLVHCFSGDCL